jgi:flagellar biogenesis protein FliO
MKCKKYLLLVLIWVLMSLACIQTTELTAMPTLSVVAPTSIGTQEPVIASLTAVVSATPVLTFTPKSVSSPLADYLLGSWVESNTGEIWRFRTDGSVSRAGVSEEIIGSFRFDTQEQITLQWPGEKVLVTIWVLDDNTFYFNFPNELSLKFYRVEKRS